MTARNAITTAFLFAAITRCAQTSSAQNIDSLVVEKSAHKLTLLHQDKAIRTYQVALGRGGMGPKRQQGDDLVPEGAYTILSHNAHSAYHLSMRISYPTPAQQQAARQQHIQPGGDIMIHGLPNGFGWVPASLHLPDWTKGCIGLTNTEMDEVYKAVPDGTPILIKP